MHTSVQSDLFLSLLGIEARLSSPQPDRADYVTHVKQDQWIRFYSLYSYRTETCSDLKQNLRWFLERSVRQTARCVLTQVQADMHSFN
jgi:hypothetical protein